MKTLSLALSVVVLLVGSNLAHAETPQTPASRLQLVYQKAMRGDPLAQFQLASFYEKGQEGLAKNVSYALSWYEESAHNGFKAAVTKLHTLASAE